MIRTSLLSTLSRAAASRAVGVRQMSVVDTVKEGIDKASKKTGEALAGTLDSAEKAASKATDTVSKTAGSVTAQATEGFSHLAEGGKGKAVHVNVTYPEPALVHPEEWEGKPITEAFNRVHPVQK